MLALSESTEQLVRRRMAEWNYDSPDDLIFSVLARDDGEAMSHEEFKALITRRIEQSRLEEGIPAAEVIAELRAYSKAIRSQLGG